mgnify:CR=1 FL=1
MLRTFFFWLIGTGFGFLMLGMLLSLPFRRDDVSVGRWLQAGPRVISEIDQFVRPDRIAIVRGCFQAGLLMMAIGVAMMSVDGMVIRK